MFTPPSLCTSTYPKLCSSLSPPFLLSRASRPGSIDDRFDEFGNCKMELELAGNAASHCQSCGQLAITRANARKIVRAIIIINANIYIYKTEG